MICDFSKKKIKLKKISTKKISKTWRAEKKQRLYFDSAQKTTLEMIHLIP